MNFQPWSLGILRSEDDISPPVPSLPPGSLLLKRKKKGYGGIHEATINSRYLRATMTKALGILLSGNSGARPRCELVPTTKKASKMRVASNRGFTDATWKRL